MSKFFSCSLLVVVIIVCLAACGNKLPKTTDHENSLSYNEDLSSATKEEETVINNDGHYTSKESDLDFYLENREYKIYDENYVLYNVTFDDEIKYDVIINDDNFQMHWIGTMIYFDEDGSILEQSLNSIIMDLLPENNQGYDSFYFVFENARWIYQATDAVYLVFTSGGESGNTSSYVVKADKIQKQVIAAQRLFPEQIGSISNCTISENVLTCQLESTIDGKIHESYILLETLVVEQQ